MGDLEVDSRVDGDAGRYRAVISPDWTFWGPNGGYLAAIALRAAGAESAMAKPASLYCHYLDVPQVGPVDLAVTTLRQSSRTHALRVEMLQDGRRILEALVWIVADLDWSGHNTSVMPGVPTIAELRTTEEIHDPDPAPFPWWQNVECKPVSWTGRWDQRPALPPLYRAWWRFRPTPTFDDRFVDASRSVILADSMFYPAAVMPHAGLAPFIAPSMDLAIRFHRLNPHAEWLLSSHEVPVAEEGLLGGYAAIWADDGALIATGGQQMLHRAVPVPS